MTWRHHRRHRRWAVTSPRRGFQPEVLSRWAATCTVRHVPCRSTRRHRHGSITTARRTPKDSGQSSTTTHDGLTPPLAHSSTYKQVLAAGIMVVEISLLTIVTPSPIHRGTGYCFRSISLYLSLFLSFFVSLLARVRENGWTDLHEIFSEGAEWPWDDLITFLVNSEKPRDAAMRNTRTGFVVLSHHSLFDLHWW